MAAAGAAALIPARAVKERSKGEKQHEKRRNNMAVKVRRVVIGYNADGKAVVKTDEQLGAVSRGGVAGVFGCEMWSTDQMPIDNSSAADAAQRAGFVPQNRNYVGTGGGALRRIDEFAPGAARFTHRTETVDLFIQLSDEHTPELH